MNKSGISPKGNRVLIKPDRIEQKTKGGIVIPESELTRHQLATVTGTVVEVGPDSWTHTTKTTYRLIDGSLKPVEQTTTGYSRPFAEEGDRVAYARHAGLPLPGVDGEEYRLINDEDVTAVISEDIDLSEFRSRDVLS